MKITQDVREYAAQKEIDERAALGIGMKEKADRQRVPNHANNPGSVPLAFTIGFDQTAHFPEENGKIAKYVAPMATWIGPILIKIATISIQIAAIPNQIASVTIQIVPITTRFAGCSTEIAAISTELTAI